MGIDAGKADTSPHSAVIFSYYAAGCTFSGQAAMSGAIFHCAAELIDTGNAADLRLPADSAMKAAIGNGSIISAGDAACLTKPDCGEGVTSSMVMMDIAAKLK